MIVSLGLCLLVLLVLALVVVVYGIMLARQRNRDD